MSNESLLRRIVAAAFVVTLTTTIAVLAQPSASPEPASWKTDRNEHIFVPTKVAIEAQDETPAPTF